MSGESRIFIWVSSRPTAAEIEAECRKILQENIDDPTGPKRVPCLMYMTEARNQGIKAENLHPETYMG